MARPRAPQARFYVVTRQRDDHVKRFRGSRRRRSPDDDAAALLPPAVTLALREEPEPEGARAICMHCRDGGAAEQLMLCDGPGCDNVSWGWGWGLARMMILLIIFCRFFFKSSCVSVSVCPYAHNKQKNTRVGG